MKMGQTKPVINLSHIQGLGSAVKSSNVAAQAAAEVSLAAVTQTAKEFQRLKDSKILKLKGGYSSDARLVFCSWRMDIQTKINENDYDNKSTIRLIKEKMQKKAHKEVEYQLDLNGAEMSYKDLLEHLNLAFVGGEDESTLMADFYSRTQKVKESEESVADELQVLGQKVISKKPNFQQGLDSMLKNQYANQLYDCHSAAIAKSLLFQLPPQTSFTQFRSELS